MLGCVKDGLLICGEGLGNGILNPDLESFTNAHCAQCAHCIIDAEPDDLLGPGKCNYVKMHKVVVCQKI